MNERMKGDALLPLYFNIMAKKKSNKFKNTNVDLNKIKRVKRGMELRNAGRCYHINKYHPNLPTIITLRSDMHVSMKKRIIAWIKKDRIYIDK